MKKTLALGLLMLGLAAPAAQAAVVLNVGHRGASGTRPEHTFASYDRALELGADYIEQDLQITNDGVLVVMHDDTLNRTARGPAENCTGRVDAKTLAQIKTCSAGQWFGAEWAGEKIPTLEEVFQRYGKTVNYYIETKTPAPADKMEEKLLALLDKYGLREPSASDWQVLIQSFSADSLKTVHALDPRLPLIFLGNASIPALPSIREYAVGTGPSSGGVNAAYVAAAHALCLDVHPYTVNDLPTMQRLLDAGVDGMFTNFPDRLDSLLGARAAVGLQGAKDAAAASRACRARVRDGAVAGVVQATLALTLGARASFGAFVPGVARSYSASTTATVVSTAGDATLTVADPSATATGLLVNGAFSLGSPLRAAGLVLPAAVKTYAAPVANDLVAVDFTQDISATEPLRTGAYSKMLTFTLSTTTP
jgi:glycerophosphoryl diester phosphodiesterase